MRRNKRVLKEPAEGNTWIVRNEEVVTAQVKISVRTNPNVWTREKRDLRERAVYAHRLISARHYTSRFPDERLIEWAELRGNLLNRWSGSESIFGSLTRPRGDSRRGDSSPAIPAEITPTRQARSSKSQHRTQNSRRL